MVVIKAYRHLLMNCYRLNFYLLILIFLDYERLRKVDDPTPFGKSVGMFQIYLDCL